MMRHQRKRRLLELVVVILLFSLFLRLLIWSWRVYLVPISALFHHNLWKMSMLPCGYLKHPFIQQTSTNSVMIMWETNCPFDEVTLLYHRKAAYRWGPKQQLINDQASEHRFAANSMEILHTGKNRFTHRVYLKNLISDSIYYYTVQLTPVTGKSSANSDTLSRKNNKEDSFYFAGDQVEKISLALVGDNHGGVNKFSPILHSIKKAKPDIFLHIGDMVRDARRLVEWQTNFFAPLNTAGISKHVPSLITMGNHDVTVHGIVDYFAPTSAIKNPKVGYYYAVTVGPMRIIFLDSTQEDSAQLQWLQEELSSTATQRMPFRMVVSHFPAFIEYWDPRSWNTTENNWSAPTRNRLITIMEKNHVDLVVSGHQHNYQRGFRNGIHYLVSGGGGGELDMTRVEDYGIYKVTIFKYHYLFMQADRTQIYIEARDLSNRAIDRVTIPRNVVRRYRPNSDS